MQTEQSCNYTFILGSTNWRHADILVPPPSVDQIHVIGILADLHGCKNDWNFILTTVIERVELTQLTVVDHMHIILALERQKVSIITATEKNVQTRLQIMTYI